MKARYAPRLVLMVAPLLLLLAVPALATNLIMHTPQGDVEIELFDKRAPNTVANFLNYVQDGDYADSFLHRSIPGFVIQGGGFFWNGQAANDIPADPPVMNEPGISNTRGTIAMAKLPGDPDSATSQWFINTADNSAELDDQNGGFTVFGRVIGNGMEVIDAIELLQTWNAGSPFTNLPLIDYPGSGPILSEHFVFTDFTIVPGFQINAGLNDAWFNPATAGQGFFIIVFPERKTLFVAMFTYDVQRPDPGVTAVLGEPGHRWFTAQGPYAGSVVELPVFITSGGVFDAAAPAPESVEDGRLIIEFEDCTAATVSYDIPSLGLAGDIPLQRIANDNVALCEALAGE